MRLIISLTKEAVTPSVPATTGCRLASMARSHGMRLARSRRPVQEKPPLEVLARAEQLPRPVGDADNVLLDALQNPIGQNHILRRHRRARQERDQFVAVVLALGKVEHPRAEHIMARIRCSISSRVAAAADQLAASTSSAQKGGPNWLSSLMLITTGAPSAVAATN